MLDLIRRRVRVSTPRPGVFRAAVLLVSVLPAAVALGLAACGDAREDAAPEGTAPAPDAGVADEEVPPASSLVILGATLLDGTGADPVPDAGIVVRDGRIVEVGAADLVERPPDAEVLDASGRWIVPGLVDAHVHFSQTGWFDGRPDAADVRDEFPYDGVMAELEREPDRYFRAYLCSGVTSTFDVGGYPWTLGLQERGEEDPRAVRVGATGPLLSTVDFWLNLPDRRQFVHMADSSAVRERVREHADAGASAIKVWYIVPAGWSSADSARHSDLVHLTGREAEREGIPLVVHGTGLWEAKDAVRAGARVLVHSVFDEPVDEEFLRLAREREVVYTPTLTVHEGYRNAFQGRTAAELPYPDGCVDDRTRELFRRGLAPEKRPAWARSDPDADAPADPRVARGIANLRRVHGAGVTVAAGTDAGNPGTAHGPAIHRETELMARAGMSPMEILVAATRNGARAMGRGDELGVLEAGRRADLVILSRDPLEEITNLAAVETVVKDGVVVHRASGGDGSDARSRR